MAEFLGLGRPIKGQHFLRAKDTNLTLLNWKLVSELKTLPHCDQNQGSRSKEQLKACLCHAEVIGPQAVSLVKRVNIAVGLSILFFYKVGWLLTWVWEFEVEKCYFPPEMGPPLLILMVNCTVMCECQARYPGPLLSRTPPSLSSLGPLCPYVLQYSVIYHVSVTCSALPGHLWRLGTCFASHCIPRA